MMEMFLVGVAVAAGVAPIGVILLGLSTHFPLATLAIAGLAAGTTQRHTDSRPATFCEGVASELRSGSSLRQAMAGSAGAIGLGAIAAEVDTTSLPETAVLLAANLPGIGPELELVIITAARTGSASADIFDEVAAMAIAQEELNREVRIAAAPARATAALFIAAPSLYLAARWAGGGLESILSRPDQKLLVAAGLTLFLGGLAWAGAVLGRAA